MELSELSSVRSTEVEGLETELVSPVYPEKRTFNVNQLKGLTPIQPTKSTECMDSKFHIKPMYSKIPTKEIFYNTINWDIINYILFKFQLVAFEINNVERLQNIIKKTLQS